MSELAEADAVTENFTVLVIFGSGFAVGRVTVSGTKTLPNFGRIFPRTKIDSIVCCFPLNNPNIVKNIESFAVVGIVFFNALSFKNFRL